MKATRKNAHTRKNAAPRRAALGLGLATLVTLGLAAAAPATTYTWSQFPPSNDWGQLFNWQNGVAPPTSGLTTSDIVFGSSISTSPFLYSAYSIRSLTFNSGASAYTFGGAGLTIGSGGITQNSASVQTFACPVLLGAAQTWTFNSAGALNFSTLNTAGFGLTVAGAGNGTIGGFLTGSGGLTKTGAGNLTLSGANSYTGQTTVSAGTLTVSGSLTNSLVSVGAGAAFNISGGAVDDASTSFQLGNAASATAATATLSAGRLSTLETDIGYRGAGVFTQTGGTHTVTIEAISEDGLSGYTGTGTLEVGDLLGSSGAYTLSGSGTLSTNNTYIGDLGTGTFTQMGGTHTVIDYGSGVFTGNLVLGCAAGSSGAYTLSGGTLGTLNTIVGDAGTGAFTQTGGTHTVGGTLTVGDNLSGNGTYTLSGGSLSTGETDLGYLGAGVFTQTGGTHTISTTLNLGSAAEVDNAGTHYSSGTYTLSGGTLTTGSVSNTEGTAIFNFNGGTLQAENSTGTFFVSYGLSMTNNVQAGGAKIDTNGFGVTVGRPLVHDAALGTLADGGLTKLGAGTLTLAGADTFTGGTTISAGTLNLANTLALQDSALTLSSTGGTLSFDSAVSANAFTLGGLAGNASLALQNNASTPTGITLSVGGNNADATYSGALSGAGGLTKTGAGTLTLSGSNTYTGGTTVRAGTVSVGSDAGLGAAGGAVTVANGATLTFTGSAVTTARTFNLGGTVSLSPASGGSITYAGATVNGGTLGAGSQVLTDGTTLNNVRTTTGTVLSQSGGTVTANTLTLSGNSTFTQAAGATLISLGDFLTTPNSAVTINGMVDLAGGSTTGALTINSGGRVKNSGSATPLYIDGSRGATVNAGGKLQAATSSTIELGGLLVNNGAQTGVLDINFGGTAKGSGTFGTVNVGDGGKFSPGNSPGTATVGGLSFGAGGGYQFEINSANATPGSGQDFIHDTGTLTITAGTTPNSQFTVGLFSLDGNNNPSALTDFDPSHTYSYTLLTADGGISGFAAGEFAVDTTGFGNGTQGGAFSVAESSDAKSLLLNFSPAAAAPEPSQWAGLGLGALGLGVLVLRARRREALPALDD